MTDNLSYEISRIDNAIEKIAKLLEKYHDKPNQFEYYSTMQECLLALSDSMCECRVYTRQYGKLLARVEILEMALATERRAKAV